MKKVRAAMILGEEDWEIRCPIGDYDSDETASKALSGARAWLTVIESQPTIQVSVDGEPDRLLQDGDVTISEFSANARARLGPPLDMREPQNVHRAVTALEQRDPAYCISQDDMVPSSKTLADFVARYGIGYKLDHIGDSVALSD